MAASRRPAANFKFTLDVEVYRPEFQLFDSVRHLDLAKLERSSRADIEVGTIKTDCCRRIVRAVIRKGRVTALKIDATPDDELAPAPAELTRLLREIQRKAPKRPERSPRLPVPVAAFMNNPGRITTDSIRCWSVCYKGSCVVCCQSETTGMWLCSAGGFIVRAPKKN